MKNSNIKKIKFSLGLLLIVFMSSACGDNDSNNPPVVDPTAPIILKIGNGTNVLDMSTGYSIIGKNFGSNRGKIVLEGNASAFINRWNDTLVSFSTSIDLIPGELYIISNDGKSSNKIKYTVASNTYHPVMLPISGGTFVMGNNSSDISSEKPEHTVTVNSFYMSETEITQKQYKEVITTKTSFNPEDDEYPANYVRFNDAARYCNKLSKMTNLDSCYIIENDKGEEILVKIHCDFSKNGFRLPTEAEWEYAAKAGKNALAPSPIGDYAWFSGNTSSAKTPFKVRQKLPNAFGLYDMNGNVEEWTWDWYSEDYYSTKSIQNPTGPDSGETRVVRGGSYRSDELSIRNTSRNSKYQVDRQIYLGFRVVRNRIK